MQMVKTNIIKNMNLLYDWMDKYWIIFTNLSAPLLLLTFFIILIVCY